MKLKAWIIGTVVFMVGCSKSELDELPPGSQQTNQHVDLSWMNGPLDTIPLVEDSGSDRSIPTTSYAPEKLYPQYTPVMGASTTSNGTTYYGAVLQGSTYSTSGSVVTFRLKRLDGLAFAAGSILKIKENNVGGTTLAIVSLTSSASTPNVSVDMSQLTLPLTWNDGGTGTSSELGNNTRNFVATWYNPVSGLNFYTDKVKIVAVPTGWGANIGSLNGVVVYSNGWGGFKSTNYLRDVQAYGYSQKYQCVNYIQRYYKDVYNRTLGNADGGAYWTSYQTYQLTQKILNGGSTLPQQGDIMCFAKNGTPSHVAIVAGAIYVSNPPVLRVYHENWGQSQMNGSTNYCQAYKDLSITTSGGHYTIGSPSISSGYTTLGWVR